MQKFILLGASRGLGWHTYLKLAESFPEAKFLLCSRKISEKKSDFMANTECFEQDFSKAPVGADFLEVLQKFDGTHLIYFAGGGPYGNFETKKWTSHQWALQTSFLYPAELTHQILSKPKSWSSLQKLVLIGSLIAEAKADPQAASYAAAKHALKGLIDSINAEQKPKPAVLLFSPGYMQTDLLPPNSIPRSSQQAENPVVVAERLIEFIENAAE